MLSVIHCYILPCRDVYQCFMFRTYRLARVSSTLDQITLFFVTSFIFFKMNKSINTILIITYYITIQPTLKTIKLVYRSMFYILTPRARTDPIIQRLFCELTIHLVFSLWVVRATAHFFDAALLSSFSSSSSTSLPRKYESTVRMATMIPIL